MRIQKAPRRIPATTSESQCAPRYTRESATAEITTTAAAATTARQRGLAASREKTTAAAPKKIVPIVAWPLGKL